MTFVSPSFPLGRSSLKLWILFHANHTVSSLGRTCQYQKDDCFLNCFQLDGSWGVMANIVSLRLGFWKLGAYLPPPATLLQMTNSVLFCVCISFQFHHIFLFLFPFYSAVILKKCILEMNINEYILVFLIFLKKFYWDVIHISYTLPV